MKKQNVIVGTLILSISSIFVRMIGFGFRVYLSNTLGAEGIGVYMLIMSVYGLCATIATSGISTAVSKLVAEELGRGNKANGKRILRRSIGLSAMISCAVAMVLFVFAEGIALRMLGDARTALSLKLLAPGLPFMSVSSCMRGYFIAERQMGNPASGQVIEQLFKMAIIMALIGYWLPKGLEYGCAVVILGISLGEVICFVYSLGGYVMFKKKSHTTAKPTVRGVTVSILKIAMPISISSYVRSALRLVEDVLILSGLKAFTGQDDVATGTYGMLKGMVMPLLIFPLSLLSAFVITLTPEISRLGASGNEEKLGRTISKILQYTSILGIFIVSIFMTFSYELGVAVYKDAQVGEMLRLMSLLCPFMCIEMVVVSILQGLGEQFSSLRYSLADCVLRVAMVYALVPISGVNGFLLMVVVSNLFTSILNLRRLLKITRLRMQLGEWVIKPGLAAMAAGQIVKVVCNFYLFDALSLWQGLALGLCLIALIYMIVLVSLGSIRAEDLAWIKNRMKLSTKPPKTALESVV